VRRDRGNAVTLAFWHREVAPVLTGLEGSERRHMLVFDIGFYDGVDTDYYLRRGHKVVAFEANPALFEAGQRRYQEAIASKQLTFVNLGVGKDDGEQIDFFIHTDNLEWSTFHKEAAQNWGEENQGP